jgi:hypothetical protein
MAIAASIISNPTSRSLGPRSRANPAPAPPHIYTKQMHTTASELRVCQAFEAKAMEIAWLCTMSLHFCRTTAAKLQT